MSAAYSFPQMSRVVRPQVGLWPYVVFAIVFVGVSLPLVFLVLGSLSTADLPTDFRLDRLGLQNYIEVWSDPQTYSVFTNTIIYVGGSVFIGISVACTFAWLVERTNIPYKGFIYACITVTLAVPGMLQAMAWVVLLSPRIGILNNLLGGIGLGPISIYSLEGIIFVEALRLVPTAFIMLVPLMRSMDPTLEEAAATSGATPASTMRRVTLRLMAPGLVAIMIFQAMTALEVFEVPGILGLPAGIYVFSTKIYSIINTQSSFPPYNKANALSMIYVLIAVIATALYARLISHSERYAVISGKGYRPRLIDLGRWYVPAMVLVALYVVLTVILPILVLFYVSLLPYLQVPSWRAWSLMTWRAYGNLGSQELLRTVLLNTAIVVIVTSTLTVMLSFFVSLVVIRSKFPARRLLDQLAFMPQAIPGIVFGLSFIWIFLKLDQYAGTSLYGGLSSICLALTITFLAYGSRAMNAALLQIHKELEEAAYTSGANSWRTWWRVLTPLLMPTFVGVWMWVALHAVRLPTIPLMLYNGPENQVLAVLIWNRWDTGDLPEVGAIGTLLIVVLLLITILMRSWGFGRNYAQ